MVQLFYYDILGRRCDHLIRVNGRQMTLELYAFEGVPSTNASSRWELRFPWFTYRYCSVSKIIGGNRHCETRGKAMCTKHDGALFVTGKFKEDADALAGKPDFCIFLTSNVTPTDFQAGYMLTGTLQRGDRRKNDWETTHFAMVRRHGY